MNYALRFNLRPGDRIIRGMYAFGIIKHFAIYIGYINGIECVIENHKNDSVHIVTADDFFSAIQNTFYIEHFFGTEQQRSEIVPRALQLRGAPYNLLHFNCEHYVNYVQYGKAESPQVKNGVLLGIVALIIGLN